MKRLALLAAAVLLIAHIVRRLFYPVRYVMRRDAGRGG